MVSRAPDKRLEGVAGLRLGRDRTVANGTRGELDPVPGQNVRGEEVGERLQRAPSVPAPAIVRASPYAAPASVSASQGMRHARRYTSPQGPPISSMGCPSLALAPAWLLSCLGLAVVRRVEPRAPVARGEGLDDPLNRLPGRRAAHQTVLGDALRELEGRGILATVDVHGHLSRLARAFPAARWTPVGHCPRSRSRVPEGALPRRVARGRRTAALRPEYWPQGPAPAHPYSP